MNNKGDLSAKDSESLRMRRAGSQSNLKPKSENQQANPGKAVKFQDFKATGDGEAKFS